MNCFILLRRLSALSLCATLALASSAGAAKTPGGILCEKKKLEATAKLLKCRQDADAAYGKTQSETKRDADYIRCERRLTETYTRLETRAFPDTGAPEDQCPTYRDAANIIAFGAAATALVTNGQASALGADAICSTTDLCAGVSCTPADQCHLAGACDPQTGLCSAPNAPDGTPCDDGDAATMQDACSEGVCLGLDYCAGVVCVQVDQCQLAGACDPQTGACSYPNAPDGTPCDDGDSSTLNDMCTGGACAGAACGDSNQSCCANSQCDGRNNCNKGTCRVCGGFRNPICQSGDECDAGFTSVGGICTFGPSLSCGDFSGDPCCPGETCAPWLTCDSGSSTCTD